MSGCVRPAPEEKKIARFSLLFWRVFFGSLKGTGTPILGKQGSKTGEWVPEAGAQGQRTVSGIFFFFWQVLFGSLKGTGMPKPDGSTPGHLVQQQGIWESLGTLTPWEAWSTEAPHADK